MEQIINNKAKMIFVVIIGFILFIGVVFAKSIFYTIDPGQEGFVFYTLGDGLDKETAKGQGLHFKWPWDKVFIYDTRIKEQVTSMEVLSNDGLTIKVELSYRYQPVAGKGGYIEDAVGGGFHDIVVAPTILSVTREVIGRYKPEDLYAEARTTIEQSVFDEAKRLIGAKNINLDAVLIRDITLPVKLQDAIEAKKVQDQTLERLREYDRKIALQEDSILQIQADARLRANKTLTSSLTPQILENKAIEATLKLAESPNSKVIVVGGDQVPFMINTGDK